MGNLPPFLMEYLGVCPSQWSKSHSEDGRDEMRTGGGLSFNEEWSSPVDHLEKAQPIEQHGLPYPTARRPQWASHCSQNKRASHRKLTLYTADLDYFALPEDNEQYVMNDIPASNLSLVKGQPAIILYFD